MGHPVESQFRRITCTIEQVASDYVACGRCPVRISGQCYYPSSRTENKGLLGYFSPYSVGEMV